MADARRVLELYPAGRVTQIRKFVPVRVRVSPLPNVGIWFIHEPCFQTWQAPVRENRGFPSELEHALLYSRL